MHEIITLQLGQRSNYIATHFWNTQESYFTYSRDEESLVDHDIHFRPGIGADGSETFTPRTLIYDLKGGFGSLKQINALYELEDEGNNIPKGLWDGPEAIQTLPPIPSNSYQKSLEEGTTPPPLSVDTVKYWSDFNRVFYHPKSIVQLNDYDLESALMPFERWDTGEELFSALDREHDLLDRDLRPFAEESDQLQGIQMMTSADDAWAGFAARYMDRLRDEYGKISLWVFGVEDGKQAPRSRQMTKDLNSAKTLCELSSLASMYIPVAMPRLSLPFYVKLDTQSQWHTSALLATAIESSTLISRLQQDQRVGLGDIENELNINGAQKIAQLCFDIRAEDDSSTISKTGSLSKPGSALGKTTARTENSSNDVKSEGRFGRGGIDEELHGVVPRVIDLFPASEEGSWTQRSTFGASDVHRGSHEADSSGTGRSKMESPIIHIHRTPLRFPQPDSFPHIFRFRNQDPTPLKIHTSLSTSSQVAIRLKHLQRALGRIPGLQESEDIQNGLNDLRTEYEEGWNSGSDEDNDDY